MPEKNLRQLLLILFAPLFIGISCATFNPNTHILKDVLKRSHTKAINNVTITAAVPSENESRELFCANLYSNNIQPVWLEIANNDDKPVWFLPYSIDSEYFTPMETSFISKSFSDPEKNRFYNSVSFNGMSIPPNKVKSGFVFTHLDEGSKEFNVDIMGEDGELRTTAFIIDIPGLDKDRKDITAEIVDDPNPIESFQTAEQLQSYLEALPCCTTNESNSKNADPLNLVMIGSEEEVQHALIRSKWKETENTNARSVWKTIQSFLFGKAYKYSPMSSLYLFGRRQDISFQKPRESVAERNHLRLWKSSVLYNNSPVWVGQISRDIGVAYNWNTIITHQIDPDVDEARDYLIQNMWYSMALRKIVYVNGVGMSDMASPQKNLSGHEYFSDGRRAVLWPAAEHTMLEDVSLLKWK